MRLCWGWQVSGAGTPWLLPLVPPLVVLGEVGGGTHVWVQEGGGCPLILPSAGS